MADIHDMTDTWNAGGTTFVAVKMNVTDTASAADSKLVELQVDSNSKFSVDKSGNVVSAANAGTAGSGTTATEYGDGFNHVTVLTMAGVLPAITGDTAQSVGLLLYTLPAGVCRVKSVHMDVGITQSQGNINADTPKVGIGSLIAATAVAVLNGTTEFDDYVVEQEAANCTGTVTDKSEDTSPAGLKLIEDGGTKTIFFNAADGWAAAAGGDAAATLSGTVTIEWTFLGA